LGTSRLWAWISSSRCTLRCHSSRCLRSHGCHSSHFITNTTGTCIWNSRLSTRHHILLVTDSTSTRINIGNRLTTRINTTLNKRLLISTHSSGRDFSCSTNLSCRIIG
jgi:hypothetical protein